MSSVDELPEVEALPCPMCGRVVELWAPRQMQWDREGRWVPPPLGDSRCIRCFAYSSIGPLEKKLLPYFFDYWQVRRILPRIYASPFGRAWSNGTLHVLLAQADADLCPAPPQKAFDIITAGYFAHRLPQGHPFPITTFYEGDGTVLGTFVHVFHRIGRAGNPASLEAAMYLDADWQPKVEIVGWHGATRKQLQSLMEGMEFIGTLASRMGGRPRDDTDIEGAIRAISAEGKDPTSRMVAQLLYPAALVPYDSLFKRLNGRDGQQFRQVFADIKRRVTG
jgi:hypothetical protein